MSPVASETVVQFIKYAIAGGVATLTHIAIFHLIAWRLFPALQDYDHAVRLLRLKIIQVNDYQRSRNSMIANVLAFMVSNMVAYVANVLWVFEAGRHHFIIEILLFYVVSGVAAFIGTGLMGVLIRRCGLLTTYAFASNIFTAVIINYAVRKFFIFNG